MNYEECLVDIHGCRRFGAAPDLSRIKRLLDGLNNPEKKLRFIHIAGTNGKGSTAAFCHSVLSSSGYKTGLFTSPYLEDFRERIQINGQMISKADIVEFAGPVLELVKSAPDAPTEFDVVTAIAISYFAAKGCDIVVLEVGLGGRGDPTNGIPVPDVAVITKIGIDHTAQLGNTIEKIALEKAGIVKSGGTVVLASGQTKQAESIIEAECKKAQAKLIKAGQANDPVCKKSGSSFCYKGETYKVKLIGEHQIENAVTAIEALSVLNLSTEQIRIGLENARWPGRFQPVSESPDIIIDSAHNPDGMKTLVGSLVNIIIPRKIFVIISIMSDKDWQSCIELIAPAADAIYAVSTGDPRALEPYKLKEYAKKYCSEAEAFESFEKAVSAALIQCEPEDALVVCGSVVLAGQASTYFRNKLKNN